MKRENVPCNCVVARLAKWELAYRRNLDGSTRHDPECSASIVGMERGCMDCGVGLWFGFDPTMRQARRCPECASEHRHANHAAWEADKMNRADRAETVKPN